MKIGKVAPISCGNFSVIHHYIFIISQLWLISHPRSTVVLLDTGTPGSSREIYSEDAVMRLELATPRL